MKIVYHDPTLWYVGIMEPLIKDYLANHTFQQLEDEHGVCARLSSAGDKASLNYDQILVKNGDLLAEQCRGMVIRFSELIPAHVNDWKNVKVGQVDVIAWPMNRFYNFGDASCHPVDWTDQGLRVYEKVDGTCIIVYWDSAQGKWHAATRSVPEADLPIRAGDMQIGDMTFSQLFLKALILTREEVSGIPTSIWAAPPTINDVIHLNKELTYVFELVSPHNQIVVSYPEPRVYLLAARHTISGEEIPIETLRLEHVPQPKTWPLSNAVAVGAFVNSINPSELEGAVICDSRFRRMKIKSMAYVLAHRSKDTITASPRNTLEAIIMEKLDDVIPLVPKEVGNKMLAMQGAFAQFCCNIDRSFVIFRAAAADSRKEFAIRVMASGDWTAPYFNLWEGRTASTRDWIRTACEKGKLPASSLDTILSKLAL